MPESRASFLSVLNASRMAEIPVLWQARAFSLVRDAAAAANVAQDNKFAHPFN
jgi:hypothetical protein